MLHTDAVSTRAKPVRPLIGSKPALRQKLASRGSHIRLREDDMRSPVLRLFPGHRYFCKHEVPFGLKRIDLVFSQKTCEKEELVAVELKLRDWRRAIWQAVNNRQVATYSFVALPPAAAERADRQLFASLGVGLIIADPVADARVALPAKRSRYVNGRAAREMAALLSD